MLFFSKKHRNKKNGGKLSKIMRVLLVIPRFKRRIKIIT